MEFIKNKVIPIIDILLVPFTYLSAVLLSVIRKMGVQRMRLSRKIFRIVGVLPIRDHYYEPLFNPKHLRYSLRKDRILPGINFNIKEQLEILSKFKYNEELGRFPQEKTNKLEFYYHNGSFGPPDAQYLYNTIRFFKPKKMIEIGSGCSTLMAENAICANKREEQNYNCEHICIEPYSFSWLENLNVRLIRKRAEEVDIEIFKELDNSDILFIDSSHIIRPQGDVLFEYLEILPILKSGVLVYIHDIFTPKDYLNKWILDEIKLWNEQYLLEAFLTFNTEYKVIAALNYLKHNYFSEISRACPMLIAEPDEEPCSFCIVRK
jgi:predicted O-methyltransferase YrrM